MPFPAGNLRYPRMSTKSSESINILACNSGRVTASLVTYKQTSEELAPLVQSLRDSSQIAAWIVVDNSAEEMPKAAAALRQYIEESGGVYCASANLGFGAGHNRGFQSLRDCQADLHLFVNPDITFSSDVVSTLISVMDNHPNVGRVMPKVVYPDGRLQRLNKLSPTPFDLFFRRFLPDSLLKAVYRDEANYELPNSYDSVVLNVPFHSGCFIFMRRSIFEVAGSFDERYFMYLEDADLSRTTQRFADNLYWPFVTVIHGHERGAHKNLKLTWVAMRSSVLYFNKWGWLFDRERTRMNRIALATDQSKTKQ
jgi:GT2 family glycosyltransferase